MGVIKIDKNNFFFYLFLYIFFSSFWADRPGLRWFVVDRASPALFQRVGGREDIDIVCREIWEIVDITI